jgi:hypothetical protein
MSPTVSSQLLFEKFLRTTNRTLTNLYTDVEEIVDDGVESDSMKTHRVTDMT